MSSNFKGRLFRIAIWTHYVCFSSFTAIPLLSLVADAQAVDVAYRVPVGREHSDCARVLPGKDELVEVASTCGGDVSLDVVRNLALETQKLVEKCRADQNHKDCWPRQRFGAGTEPITFRSSLFESQVPENCFPEQTWASLSLFKEWNEAFTEYLEFSRSGSVRFDGFIVAEASRVDGSEQHLVTCEVKVIEGLPGAPRDCYTAAIIAGSEVYIRVRPDWHGGCFVSGVFRPSGAIHFNFEVSNVSDIKPFSERIHDLLKKDFKFATEYKIYNSSDGAVTLARITATSGIRNTVFLDAGYREAMDLEVLLQPRGDVLVVSASTQPMVSRTNTGKIKDLRGPDDNERQRYLEIIDAKLAAALMSGCTGAQQIDSLSIRCQ